MTVNSSLFNKIGDAVASAVADTHCSDLDILTALAALTKSCIRACRVDDADYLLKAVYIQNCILSKISSQESLLTWAAALAENLEQLLGALQNREQEVVYHG